MHQEQKELLQELYETYQKPLRLAALSTRVPASEVDDIIQDTFVAFMYNYGDEFSEWSVIRRKGTLMRILKNRCYDYFRRLDRHKEVSIDDEDDFQTQMEILESQIKRDVSHNMIEEEELGKIRESIREMSSALRDVAILYMIEGRPRQQVCEILGISDSVCRMRISRIRSYIRNLLKDMDQQS